MLSHKWTKPIFGLMLVIALAFHLKERLTQLTFSNISMSAHAWGMITLVFILAMINWLLEAGKWKWLMPNVNSWKSAVETVLVGVSFAIFTPGRVGDYAGRALHTDAGERKQAVAATFLSSMSQLTVTLIFGVIGCTFFAFHGYGDAFQQHYFWLSVPLLLGLIAYYKMESMLDVLDRLTKFKSRSGLHIQPLGATDKTVVLALSALRYAVYSLQMLLLMWAFNINIPWNYAIFGITILFLVQTVIPMPMLFQAATKIELAIILWAAFDPDPISLSIIILTLWCVNVVIPAFIGYYTLNFNKLEKQDS